MKIPETSANVGAYYGNEEHGQWQPNGVVIDNGVGGGVVGSGDAGVRPVYPVHIPRHMPTGYVMAGAYYPPQFAPAGPPQPTDFEDYMWMENEEEFDKQVIQQLEEEALMEQCIEAMLEDEQRERRGPRPPRQPRDPNAPTTSSCNGRNALSLQEAVSRSTLNPLAAEFVPTPRLTQTEPAEVKAESTEETSARPEEPSGTEADTQPTESAPEPTHDPAAEEAVPPPKDPPEVSAAAVLPLQKGKPRDKKDTKKPAKVIQEVKKTKPVVVKSEPKLQKEVRELKAVKSESDEPSVDRSEPALDNAPKPVAAVVSEEEPCSGVKPINYAAAAKAMKPKPKPQDKELKPKPQEKESKPKPQDKEPKPKQDKEPKPKQDKEIKPKPQDKELKKSQEVKPAEKKDGKTAKSTASANKDKLRKNSAK